VLTRPQLGAGQPIAKVTTDQSPEARFCEPAALGDVDTGGCEFVGDPADADPEPETPGCDRLECGGRLGDPLRRVERQNEDAAREHDALRRCGEERRSLDHGRVVAVVAVVMLAEPEGVETSFLGSANGTDRLLEQVCVTARPDVRRLHREHGNPDVERAGDPHVVPLQATRRRTISIIQS
jgi:hypothetical protein